MKICSKCGFENKDNAKFCVKCGNSLDIKISKSFPINDNKYFVENKDKYLNSENRIKEEPNKYIKFLYKFDEDENRYRLGKVKIILFLELIFAFILTYTSIPSTLAGYNIGVIILLGIIVGLFVAAIFIIPTWFILFVIKKLYFYFKKD